MGPHCVRAPDPRLHSAAGWPGGGAADPRPRNLARLSQGGRAVAGHGSADRLSDSVSWKLGRRGSVPVEAQGPVSTRRVAEMSPAGIPRQAAEVLAADVDQRAMVAAFEIDVVDIGQAVLE